ncbi:hypothetical protein [Nonomuraea candida]|uniref:hypothetical protein n=1 Tax=Nonomuraea candida TaxID=359159 RepID=UPI0005BD33DB|nr:hypothetical protein [Nonomuraea candida]
MMRIGVTGHMNLNPETAQLVSDAIRAHLATMSGDELVGVSCIARGADSLFADAILEAGGALEVVLPSRDYREAKVKPDHVEQFERLMAAASVRVMDFDHANREAYEAANEAVLSSIDELVAVWDGQPGTGRGGTAEVVAEARERGLPVTVIWPDGASRE